MRKFICSLFFLIIPSLSYAEGTQTVIDFQGEIVDQDALPVSGVLPLEFRIFSEKNAKKAIATEKHFISIVDGGYSVSLGENSEIRTKNTTLFVAVYMDGKELTSQEVRTLQQVVTENARTTETDEAEGTSGDFSLECPPGHVVTGIKGVTQNGVQKIRLVCSKII